jgi:hypothetical protein
VKGNVCGLIRDILSTLIWTIWGRLRTSQSKIVEVTTWIQTGHLSIRSQNCSHMGHLPRFFASRFRPYETALALRQAILLHATWDGDQTVLLSSQGERNQLCVPLFCRLCAASVNILSSFSLYWLYMFRPTWPSSGVLESAAHCNAVVVTSGSSLCGLSSCPIWVSLKNCYACVCLICNM